MSLSHYHTPQQPLHTKCTDAYSVLTLLCFAHKAVMLLFSTGLQSFRLITAKAVEFSLVGEAHYFTHKERLIECFQMRGNYLFAAKLWCCMLPTGFCSPAPGSCCLWRHPTETATSTCSTVTQQWFTKMHYAEHTCMQQCCKDGWRTAWRKKNKDNGSHRWISFNKIKTGYWYKDLEGKDLAAMGICPEIFLFWKNREQRKK